MQQKKMSTKVLLANTKIENIKSDVNAEMIERRSFFPKKIHIFSHKYTSLENQPQYAFNKDKEAEKQLSDIINNRVQKVVPNELNNKADQDFFNNSRNIGVFFSGGPAPGGHNVICGIYDEAKRVNKDSKIFGFLTGPDGLIEGKYIEITQSLVDTYRNMGGFSMLRTGRTKIDTPRKMELARQTCIKLKLDALVVIGGDDSNTNAAFLAQSFYETGIQVIGVPKTIDGDLQVKAKDGQILCAVPFGFHTAARTYAQSISNLAADAGSDVKYWHVCKVMGRVASHLALECALQTHANITLIGEELADYIDEKRLEKAKDNGIADYTAYGMTLRHISRVICDAIVKRAAYGKNYGVIIIPEGLLEFINEIQVFIIKLNKIIGDYNKIHDNNFHYSFPTLDQKLEYLARLIRGGGSKDNFPIWNLRDDGLFNQLPTFFQEGLLVERDMHGNFQFSQVKTEKIVMDMVKDYLDILKEQGKYKIGIHIDDFTSRLSQAGYEPDIYGPVIFKNYKENKYLLIKESIISRKTLKQELTAKELINQDAEVPEVILSVFEKSQAKFKTQTYFYGYEGRSSDPTHFDCNYTYNLGMTAFHLIVNGVTGQLAAIKNLEHTFEQWEPIGIPIANLMHLEERKGKLELVIEKSLVDLESNAFRIFKELREDWLAAGSGPDRYRRPGPVRFTGKTEEDQPITLTLNSIH